MMPIDSITKTFVAAELMLLARRGRVELDAPASRYLTNPLTANGATVRQLLGMRSGLADPPYSTYVALTRLEQRTPLASWTTARTLAYLKPTVSAPSRVPVYANTNFLLLGLLIEKLTSQAMAHVLRTNLFDPAHLARMAAQDQERPSSPMAQAPRSLVPQPDGFLPSRPFAHVTHDTFGGIAADAPTVALWGYQLYGARLLSPAEVHAMTTPATPDSIAPSTGYGLGTMVFYQLSTDPTFGHEGGGPASTSILVVVPARHLSLALLTPETGRNLLNTATDLIRAFP